MEYVNIPGDEVLVELRRKRRPAKLLKILTPSPFRCNPRCAQADICGGCVWQVMDYETQLNFKEKKVLNTFQPYILRDAPAIIKIVKEITGDKVSLYLRVKKNTRGSPTEIKNNILSGPLFIREKLQIADHEYFFKISPDTFFQPNTLQAEILYTAALKLSGVKNNDLLLDLYCGSGSLGIVFSRYFKRVIGIELNMVAAQDAQENIILNKTKNFTVHAGDTGEVLDSLSCEQLKPDLVIVDPPRAGLDALALHHLKILNPQKIIYISCNPITQAENISQLQGYRLTTLQPVDQFPHTAHIENIACLER